MNIQIFIVIFSQRLNQRVLKRNIFKFTPANIESLQRLSMVIRTLRSTKLAQLEVRKKNSHTIRLSHGHFFNIFTLFPDREIRFGATPASMEQFEMLY